MSPHDAAFDKAVRLFDERRFFEAHEWFEAIWKSPEIDPDERRFWRGVTQVAVGCCHIQRGNARGASGVLRRAAKSLAGCPSPYRGVETRELIAHCNELADRVERGGAESTLQFPRFPLARN